MGLQTTLDVSDDESGPGHLRASESEVGDSLPDKKTGRGGRPPFSDYF